MQALFRAPHLVLLALTIGLAFIPLPGLDRPAAAESAATAVAPPAGETRAWGTAPPYSNRLIVEFGSPALAEVYAREQLATHDADTLRTLDSSLQTYAIQLENEHQAFETLLLAEYPAFRPSRLLDEAGQLYPLTFAVVKNGAVFELSGDLQPDDRLHLASLPNVKNLFLDYEVFPQLYAGPNLTQLDVLWSQPTFDRSASGKGIRIASIDGGLHKDAAMFNGAHFPYPPGYPADGLGIAKANNGKIVASRTYFRPNVPPVASDNFPWPGSGSSHGVHTAAIAAGNVVTDASFRGTPLPTLSGVAPGAWLGSYRVFYRSRNGKSTFFTAEGVAAIEDAIVDGMDIVIGSWGSGPSINLPPYSFLDSALVNTVHAGVVVVMAAGNYGPLPFSTANPSAEYMTVGAVSTAGRFAMGRMEAHTSTRPSALLLTDQQFAHATLGPRLAVGTTHNFALAHAAALAPHNALGCEPWPDDALQGQMLLVQRGLCTFHQKVAQAQQAGARGVLVFNHAAGGQSLVKMAPSGSGPVIRIPSLFLGHQAGVALSQLLTAYPDDVAVRISTAASQVGNQPRVIPDYSGRGPTAFGTLKPDLVAPGDHIMSQGYGGSALDTRRHLGYGQTSGTSMATPFVAGAVALLKEKHPAWTADMIRSALMNTAQYQGIFNQDGSVAQPTDMGAGLIDLTAALETQLIVSPPQVDFGRLRQTSATGFAREMQLTHLGSARVQYRLSAVHPTDSGPAPMAGVAVEPATVSLAAGESARITVSLQPDNLPVPSYRQGYLVIQGATAAYNAPIFAWLDFPPAPRSILLLDADLSPLYPDYAPWYRAALDDLNLEYVYWDAARHEQQVPAWINSEAGPEVILLYTGDQGGTEVDSLVPVPFAAADLQKLQDFVQGGGALWVMGRDIDRVLAGSDLGQFILGSAQVQRQTADRLGLPQLNLTAAPAAPAPWQDMTLDVGRHDSHLGTVNLLTGEDVQRWNWQGQYLSGTVTYALAGHQPNLRYQIHLQSGGPFRIESAQLRVADNEGRHEPVQNLLGEQAPLAVNGAFRWKGVLPLTASLQQARMAEKLQLQLVLQGTPPVTLETQVPTRDLPGDSADGPLPLHGIRGADPDTGLTPILGTAQYGADPFWVVGVSRTPPAGSAAGPVLLTTFGLEHVNDASAATARSALLRTALRHLYPELAIPAPPAAE